MPGCWLKNGENEILVFDIVGPHDARSEGLKSPKLDQLLVKKTVVHRKAGQSLDLSTEKPTISSEFKSGNGWQEVTFDKPITGRFICLEALDAIDGKDIAAIAEMYLLDTNGKRLSREPWTVIYADSEETTNGNHTADKTFDLQESTYWQTSPSVSFPHSIVIDLGDSHILTGYQYLPRMEKDVPGGINRFKLYVKDSPFTFY